MSDISFRQNSLQNVEDFKNTLQYSVQLQIGDGYQVITQKIEKPNGLNYIGLAILNKQSDTNVVYNVFCIEELFSMYQKGKPIAVICQEILTDYMKFVTDKPFPISFDTKSVHDFNKMKDKIICDMINLEQNRDYLSDKPYRTFLDLAVIIRIEISRKDNHSYTIPVNNDVLSSWNISEDELFDTAEQNTKNKICGRIEQLQPIALDNKEQYSPIIKVETEYYPCAVNALTDENFLETVTYKLFQGDSFYIQPISAEEFYCIAKTFVDTVSDIQQVKNIFHSVNIPADAFLSDNLYYYDKDTMQLEIVS